MAVGARLTLRCFLEGVEVPVVSANIQSQKNAPAVCSLQLPANDYLLDLKPRTLVHLFSYDGYRGAPIEQAVWVAGEGISLKQKLMNDPEKGLITAPLNVTNPELTGLDLANDNYKLVFGGEVVGVAYSKQPQSRGMVLQCVDWSSYWDIAYQYQVSGYDLGSGGVKAAFTGASTTVFNNFLEGSGDIVKQLLSTEPRGYKSLQGTLLGGLMNLIQAIGGCYYGSRAVKGTNDFFSLAEMRLHISQMVGANPYSAKDELRLLSANGFGSLFTKTLGGLGKLVTIRQILLALQRYIFHEIIPITSPRYVASAADPTLETKDRVPLAADQATSPLVQTAEKLRAAALELKGRQEASTDLVSADSQSSARGGLIKELTAQAKTASKAQAQAKKVALRTSGGMQEVAARFETAARQFLELAAAARTYSTTNPQGQFPLTSAQGADRVVSTLEAIAEGMKAVTEASFLRPRKGVAAQADPPPRLLQQIYRPDVWMVAPPRCNVLFPEQYNTFSYGRNFLGEVSRILLKTHEAFYGPDVLFDGMYVAPSKFFGARKGAKVAVGRFGIEPPDLSDAPGWVARDMMDHELFTGIIPAFERMSDLNLHAIRGGTFETKEGFKVGFAQLACNHLFFQYRFRSRNLMASGMFNPYAVLGFPMVIVDKYLADDALRGAYDPELATRLAGTFANLPASERANISEIGASAKVQQLATDISIERASTHYLGTPDLISHSIDARSGGTTQFQMGYARTTAEKTEFLGDNMQRARNAKQMGTARVPSVIAATQAPIEGSKGVRGGKIIKVQDVTDRYQKKQPKIPAQGATQLRFASSSLIPLFEGGENYTGRVRRGTRVPVGIMAPASAYGPEVVALVGSGGATNAILDGQIMFKAFRIVEELGTYVAQDVEIPPEELTFPPWYGENYRTNQIGGLYSYYFDVGAITDPTVVLGGPSPRKFGDGDGRDLLLELENDFSLLDDDSELPPVGTSDKPSIPGADAVGPTEDPNAAQKGVLGSIPSRSPVKKAIDDLVRIYSATRSQHYDTPGFVHNYTYRRIASMVDLFGTADLEINEVGQVQRGREGFHSRAFGSYDDLRQLVASGPGMPETILGLKANKGEIASDQNQPDAKVAQRLDTRKEKQLMVFRYLTALSASRGVVLG